MIVYPLLAIAENQYAVENKQTILPSISKKLREFGINHNRYAFCRLARVGKIAIPLPIQSCSGGMVSCFKPANQPSRRSHSHSSENTLSKP